MAMVTVQGRNGPIRVESGNSGGAGGHEGFKATGAPSTYRGWSVWQTRGGSWAASDGRRVSHGAAINGIKTLALMQTKIDSYLARQT